MNLVHSMNGDDKSLRSAAQLVPATFKPSAPMRTPRLTASDREFLPAALEILVTPPSPVAKLLLLVICALFGATLAWSYFGWMDIHAVASGKIQPVGGSKVVQPLEAGKVVAIHVENGSRVNVGDVLVELDPTEVAADRETEARELEAAKAEMARREAAIAATNSTTLELPLIVFAPDISEQLRRREQAVLAADLAQLRSAVATIKAQLGEKDATKERLTSAIAQRQKLIGLASERVAMRQKLDSMGAGSRAQTIEVMTQYETQIANDASDRGQLIETNAAMVELDRKIDEAIKQFVADQSQKLAAVQQKRDHLEEDLIKAQSKLSRAALKAPIAGTVQQLIVSSIGQVVVPGQPLLTIVPGDDAIEVRAMVANQDIGFVEAGQLAVVKVDAFPFTRYGTIEAIVEKVSGDAVDERDAAVLSDAANAARPQQAAPTSPANAQHLLFPATIRLAQRFIDIDGKQVSLLPGMAVTVEIKTGRRRVIDYLLSPLREVVSQAGRER